MDQGCIKTCPLRAFVHHNSSFLVLPYHSPGGDYHRSDHLFMLEIRLKRLVADCVKKGVEFIVSEVWDVIQRRALAIATYCIIT